MSKARSLSLFISDPSIEASEIGSNAITTDKIADLNVTHDKLHSNLDLTGKTVTFADDAISGNKINSGVISNFASTGIDDNASSIAVTIDSNSNVGIGDSSPSVKLDVYQSTVGIGVVDFRHVNGNRILINPSYNYYDAYNHIFRGLNGTDTHMTIDNSGNVGIGTSTISSAKLEVSGGGVDIQDTGYPRVRFYVGSTFKGGVEAVQNANSMISTSAVNDLAIRSQSNMLFAAGGNTEAMRINSSGNVGIGTDDPGDKVTIANGHLSLTDISYGIKLPGAITSDGQINHRNAGSVVILHSYPLSNQTIRLKGSTDLLNYESDKSGVGSVFSMTTSGKVGIGTADPQNPLDVSGAIKQYGAGASQSIEVVSAQAGGYSTCTIEIQYPGAGSFIYEVGVSGTSGCNIQFGGGYTNGTNNYSHAGTAQVGNGWNASSPSHNMVRLVATSGVGVHPTAYVKTRWGLSGGLNSNNISIAFS